jgi:hypothetical protein
MSLLANRTHPRVKPKGMLRQDMRQAVGGALAGVFKTRAGSW